MPSSSLRPPSPRCAFAWPASYAACLRALLAAPGVAANRRDRRTRRRRRQAPVRRPRPPPRRRRRRRRSRGAEAVTIGLEPAAAGPARPAALPRPLLRGRLARSWSGQLGEQGNLVSLLRSLGPGRAALRRHHRRPERRLDGPADAAAGVGERHDRPCRDAVDRPPRPAQRLDGAADGRARALRTRRRRPARWLAAKKALGPYLAGGRDRQRAGRARPPRLPADAVARAGLRGTGQRLPRSDRHARPGSGGRRPGRVRLRRVPGMGHRRGALAGAGAADRPPLSARLHIDAGAEHPGRCSARRCAAARRSRWKPTSGSRGRRASRCASTRRTRSPAAASRA